MRGVRVTVILALLVNVTQPRHATGSQEELASLLDKEVRLAERLIEAFPDSEEPLVLMGNVYSRRGDIDQALSFWQKAVRKNPKRLDVYDKMANLALQVDQQDKAISLWRKALELDSALPEVHYKIADALVKSGRYEDGIREIREEIRISGDKPLYALFLGQAYQHLGECERAKENYQRVIELQPDNMKAYYGLYIVCARLKQSEEAQRYLAEFKTRKAGEKEAIRHADESTLSDLDCCYDSLGRFCFDVSLFHGATGGSPQTEQVLKEAFALGQNRTAFLRPLADLYSAMNRRAEALALYQRIVQIDPEDASGQLSLGIASVQVGRFADAEKAFRRAIELTPQRSAGYQELARLYLRTKANLPEARALAQKAVELDARADTYYDLGVTCLACGDTEGSLAALEKAVELDPANPSYARIYQLALKKKESE